MTALWISNTIPATMSAALTGSILQEQPPAAPKELKAPAVKTPADYSPTQQPAAVVRSDHSATAASGPIPAPRQPPAGNKRSPAPTARGGAPVTAPSAKQQQPASATVASTKKVLHGLSQKVLSL